MASIHLLCGIQGSGKSTLCKKFSSMFSNGVVVEPDAFRKILCGTTYDKNMEGIVWVHVKTAARVSLSQDRMVCIDATNTTKKDRRGWIDIAKEYSCPISLLWVVTPLQIAIERNALREFPVPEDVIKKFALRFELPRLEEGFTYIQLYNSEQTLIETIHSNTLTECVFYNSLPQYPYRSSLNL